MTCLPWCTELLTTSRRWPADAYRTRAVGSVSSLFRPLAGRSLSPETAAKASAHEFAEPMSAEHRPVACILLRMNRFAGDERFNRVTTTCPPLNAKRLRPQAAEPPT